MKSLYLLMLIVPMFTFAQTNEVTLNIQTNSKADFVQVEFDSNHNFRAESIKIFNSKGQAVDFHFIDAAKTAISTKKFKKGKYWISYVSNNGLIQTKPLLSK